MMLVAFRSVYAMRGRSVRTVLHHVDLSSLDRSHPQKWTKISVAVILPP